MYQLPEIELDSTVEIASENGRISQTEVYYRVRYQLGTPSTLEGKTYRYLDVTRDKGLANQVVDYKFHNQNSKHWRV